MTTEGMVLGQQVGAVERPVALVTGGTTGIGLATVRRLLAAGAKVVVASRDARRGRRVVSGLPVGRAVFLPVDVTDEAAVASLVEESVRRFRHLDWLFNNAGVEGTVGPMAAWPAEVVDAVFDVNVKGTFLCMKHVAPKMGPGSVIVNCSSLLATTPMPQAAPYAASKAALLSLTRSAAAEVADRGITVLAVCPGVVDTPMMDRVSLAAGAPKAALAATVCPSGRLTSPERVAEAVSVLFSNPSMFACGAALWVGPDTLEPLGTSSVGATIAS